MERLREENQVDGAVFDGQLFHVALAKIDIVDAIAEGLFAAHLDHFERSVDGDDLGRSLRQQQGKSSLAGAQVGDDHGRHEAQQGLGQALPRLSGDVVATQAAGHGVKEAAHLVLALAQDEAGGGLVGGGFGNLFAGLGKQAGEDALGGFGLFEPVEIAFAGAPVFDEASLLQLREVGGDGALAHDQDLLQLGDRKFFALEQQEDAEPVGIGEHAQDFDN